ncbi:MAG: diacylglycerol kinase [Deinococcus sp.]|nr:diacylglycerol kinase [Deinococcus sp.]
MFKSFRHAWDGLSYAWRTQQNLRIELALGAAALTLGVLLGLGPLQLAILVGTAALVLCAELFNTALEALADLASPGPHHLARIAKDAAAAGVLLCAGLSVVIGLLLLGPPLIAYLTH